MMKEIKLKTVNLWLVFIASVLLGAGVTAFATEPGNNDQSDQVFDSSFVHEIKIDFYEPEVWEDMRNNERYIRRKPQEATVTFDDEQLEDVGVATAFLRETDAFYLYPNLRVNFGHIRSNQRLLGVRGIDLKSFGSEDKSLIHERLAWELFFRFGVPASRTAYARLTVNGEYIGAYLIIESVSDVVARPPLANDRGNLYLLKNTSRWPSRDSDDHDGFQLAPQNPNEPSSYIMERRSEHKPFERPVRNPADGRDLVALIWAFNHATPETVRMDVERRLDLNSLIDYLAVDMALANTDGLIAYGTGDAGQRVYVQNNTFFYHPLTSEKFFVMPYNLKSTFDAFDSRSFNRDLEDGWDLMRITRLLLNNPDLSNRYLDRVQNFVDRIYNVDEFTTQRIEDLKELVKPAVVEDLNRPNPPPRGRRMTVQEWEKHINDLSEYMRNRRASLQQQLLNSTMLITGSIDH